MKTSGELREGGESCKPIHFHGKPKRCHCTRPSFYIFIERWREVFRRTIFRNDFSSVPFRAEICLGASELCCAAAMCLVATPLSSLARAEF